MSDERDLDLGRALRALPTPEHRPEFWEDLERQLVVEEPAPGVRGRRRRFGPGGRRPSPGTVLLAIAAAVALVVAAVAALRPEDREGTRVVTEPPTTTTTTAPPSYRPRPERALGDGIVTGVSADGTAALVVAPDPESDSLGCEGSPASALFAVPLDGSARRRAVPGPEPIPATLVRSTADPRRVAVVSVCEEFLSELSVAREEAGGVLSDVTAIDPRVYGDLIAQFAWSADGSRLLAVVSGTWDVVRIDPATGARELVLSGANAFQAAELADGTLAVVTRDGRLRLGGEVHDLAVFDLTLSPDGRQVAAYGEGGLYVTTPGGPPRRLVTGHVTAASWSPDGRALSFAEPGAYPDGGPLSVVTLDGTTTQIAAGGTIEAGHFALDGRALVFTRLEPPEAEGETAVAAERVVVVRFE